MIKFVAEIIGFIVGCIIAVFITVLFDLKMPFSMLNGIVCGFIFTKIGMNFWK